jgi:hypothetical protein
MLHVTYLERDITVAASDRKQIRKVICENMSPTSSATSFIRFVRLAAGLEATVLTISSGIKKLKELPACSTNYLSLCSVYLELQPRRVASLSKAVRDRA